MEHVVWHHRVALGRPVVVLAFAGWNDAGECATTAVRFLAEQLGSVQLASVEPEPFYDFTVARPRVRLADGIHRSIKWTTADFHAAAVPTAHDYLFGWGPEPH